MECGVTKWEFYHDDPLLRLVINPMDMKDILADLKWPAYDARHTVFSTISVLHSFLMH